MVFAVPKVKHIKIMFFL